MRKFCSFHNVKEYNMKYRVKKISAIVAAVALTVLFLVVTERRTPAAELPFVEQEMLAISPAEIGNEQSQRTLASNVARLVSYDQDTKKFLYLTYEEEDVRIFGTLWVSNTEDGAKRKIANGVYDAQFAPDGQSIAFWNREYQVRIAALDGTLLEQVGLHGATPVFSGDGRYLAYQKLADSSFDDDPQSLYELSPGIAIYDLETGEESIIIHVQHGEDFSPVAFSADNRFVYFHSSRSGYVSLWSVQTDGSDLKQLTNMDVGADYQGTTVPMLSQNALWTTNGTIAISSLEGSQDIWLFRFDGGNLLQAKVITGGSQPQWVVRDKTIAFRVVEGSRNIWRQVTIQ